MKRNHSGRLATSDRLRKVRERLLMGWATPFQIIDYASVTNPSGVVSECRQRGLKIKKRWNVGVGCWEYRA